MASLRIVFISALGVYAAFLAVAIFIRSDDSATRPPPGAGTYYTLAGIHRFSADKFLYSSPVMPLFGRFQDSDYDRQYSPILIYENDKPLPFPHTRPDAVEDIGLGRYAHLGAMFLFSTSDNSDPATNGRSYWAVYPEHHVTAR